MYFSLEYAKKSLRIQRQGGDGQSNDFTENISEIIIYNAFDLQKSDFGCYFTDDTLEAKPLTVDYDAEENVLRMKPKSPTLIYDEIKLV
jgi:hypothetical protein